MKPNCALPSFNFTRAARILGACNIIEPKVFMKRKLSLIYLNERSKIAMNGNFEPFNITCSSFLRYLELCNMQTVAVVGFKKPSLNYDGINYQNVPQRSI